MKKMLSVLLSVLLLLSMLPIGGLLSATAADEPTIVVSDAVGKAGDIVTVTVCLENNPGLVSAKVKIGYDATALELVDKVAGDFPASAYTFSPITNNPFVINFCDGIAAADYTDELFATLTFKIKDSAAAGSYPLTLIYSCEDDFYNSSWDTIYFDADEGSVTVEADTPDVPEDSASAILDFTDIANRTSYSTEQQVWQQNGIKLTNDKGASTSNVGNYGGDGYPARFYKGSTVKIEYPGMTKLVIDCHSLDTKYINSWADSAVGATAIVDGSNVIITFAQPVDSFVWETLTAQGRAYSITVYNNGASDEPVVTDPTIVVSDATGKPGDIVSVNVNLKNNPGLVSAKVKVGYDADALELVDKAAGDFPASAYTFSPITNNPFVINFCDGIAAADYTDELFATLTFKIKDGAVAGTYPLTLEYDCEGDFYNLDWDTIWFDADEGSVTVEATTPVIPYEPVEGNLITNGSFETGDATGWITWQDTTVDADAAHSGYYGAHLKGNGGWGGMLNQTIAVTPGATYKLSFWINVVAVGVNVQVKDGAGAGIANAGGWFDVNKNYHLVEWTFVAPDDTVFVNFCGSGTNKAEDVYVDDFALVMVAEPPVPEVTPTIVVSDVTGKPGDTVTVTVSLKDNPGLVSAKVKVGYDADALELVDKAAGDFPTSGYTWSKITNNPFVINFCDAIAAADFTHELFATLTFKIKDGAAAGTYPLTLEYDCEGDFYNLDWDTIWFDADEGSVTVESTGHVHEYDYACDADCNICGEIRPVHRNIVHVDYKAPTAYVDGNIEYWFCPDCGMAWLNAALTQITNLKQVILPATGPETKPTIVVSDVTGKPGDTVTVTVSLKDNPGLISAKVKVGYDADALELVDKAAGDFPANSYSWSYVTNNPFVINFCDAIAVEDYTYELLATLTFKIKDGAAAGTYPLTLEYDCEGDFYDTDWNTIWFEADEGSLTVEATTPDIPDIPDEPVITGPTIVLPNIMAAAGDTITVPVMLKNNPGLVSAKVKVGYDASVLELAPASGKASEFVGDFPANGYSWGQLTKNPFVINFCDGASYDDYTYELLAVLTFKVKDNAAAGSYALTLEFDCESDFYNAIVMDSVYFDGVNGSVIISDVCRHAYDTDCDPVCNLCGERRDVHTENVIHFDAIQPGCHFIGNTEFWYCTVCETVWADEALTQITNHKNVILPATGGNVIHFDAVQPACHYVGNIEYWYCTECEQFWQDEALTQLTNSKNVILPALGGKNVQHFEAVAPTCQSEGNIEFWYCPDCEQFWQDKALTQITNAKNVILGMTDHSLVHIDAVEPACHYDGIAEHWYCTVCETVWADEALTQITNHKNVIVPAIGGDVIHFDAVAPGCHFIGNIEYWFCPDCEQFWQDEALTQLTNSKNVILPATGGNVVHFDAVAPGCHYIGNIEYWYCTDCGQYWQDEAQTQLTNSKNIILPALGSENLQHVAAMDPTCYSEGNIEYWFCPDCEQFWQDEALTQLTNAKNVLIAKIPHTYVPTIGYAATCIAPGLTDGEHCGVCGDIRIAQEVIPALGHVHVTIDGYDATCTATGLTDGEYCSRCNETLIVQETIPALGHVHATLKGCDPTCTETGLTDGEYCSRCNETLIAQESIPAYGHSYTVQVTLKPTCGTEGERTYSCYACDHAYTESIPATGEHVYDHQYDAECNNCGSIREVSDIPADAPAFVVDNVNAKPGQTFNVSIRIQNNPGIVSFKLQVHYDADLFELVSHEDGPFGSGNMSYGPTTKNPFIVNWVDAISPDNTANDAVVTLTFRVKEDVEKTTSTISLSYDIWDVYNAAWESVFFNTIDGTVNVTRKGNGDVDGNGVVNNRDFGYLKQYLNGWDNVTINEAACDVDGDGRITNRDLGYIQQYINDWDVDLG